jgi:hypothetical protein
MTAGPESVHAGTQLRSGSLVGAVGAATILLYTVRGQTSYDS